MCLADVQLEHGHFKLANRIGEAIVLASFSGAQLKMVLCILRLTWGWRRQTVRISYPDLARSCDLRLAGGFRRAFDELIENGVIHQVQAPSGRIPGAYMMNKNFEEWGKFSVSISKLQALFGTRPACVDRVPKATERGQGYVYYALDHDTQQVKIGFSMQPWQRITDMRTARPSMELVGVEPGTRRTEGERHQQFAHLLVARGREWFAWSEEIENHVLSIEGASLGAPKELEPSDPVGSVTPEIGDPTGRVICPQEGSHDTPKSLNGETFQRPKDRKDSVVSTEEKDQHTNNSNSVVAAAADGAHDYAVKMAVAANTAITERWGAQPAKGVLLPGPATQLAADLIALGVPLDLAKLTIASVTNAKRGEPPRTLEYFRDAIVQAHEAAEQLALVEAEKSRTPRGGPPAPIAAVIAPARRTDDELRALQDVYAVARNLAIETWVNAHPGEYRAIRARVAETYADFGQARWVETAIAQQVLSDAADRAGFPKFDAWLENRDTKIPKKADPNENQPNERQPEERRT